MFSNRLKKRSRHLGKWARREGVSCYRIYDRDIPEIPLVVDWYEGRLHVSEFERRHGRTEEEHELWLDALIGAACEVLGVDAQDTFFKRRRRQKGSAQYEKLSAERSTFVVDEGGLKFEVNLSDYLDTGLFLDHRPTRLEVGREARDKRFLNLFAYTGAFTVHAVAGGARSSLTLDMSNTYLSWAARNMSLNNLPTGKRHRLERVDCCAWLRSDEYDGLFDLVLVDPPSFSNSTSMSGTFDVQRDHAWLLEATIGKTAPGGVIYFSTNRRGFQLDAGFEGHRELDALEDITSRSLELDFEGSSIHRCFKLTRARR